MNKKIFLITSNLSSLIAFRGDFLQYAKQQNCSCSVIGFGSKQRISKLVEKIFFLPFCHRKLTILFFIKSIFKIKKIIQQGNPESIFVYQTISIFLYLNVLLFIQKPKNSVIFFEGLGILKENSIKGKFARQLLKGLFFLNQNKVTKLIFVNKNDYCFLLSLCKIKNKYKILVLNGWGVNPKNKNVFLKKRKITKPRFLMTARLLRTKGIFDFLEAASFVRKTVPKAEFFLCGSFDENHPEGIEKKRFFQELRKSPVRFLGFLKKMESVLKQSNIFVLPTFYNEGFPFSLLEAMAARMAILTTRMPGCKNAVIPGKNGFFVPRKNSKKLAQKMIYLAKNLSVAHRMGLESRRLVIQNFDSRCTSKKVFDFVLS